MKSLLDCRLRTHLWAHRFYARLTQAQLAARVGVSRHTIMRIENGTEVPSVLLALCIAKELGDQVEDLFGIVRA